MDNFAERLKTARKAAGLSQKKLAENMLFPSRTIEDWVRAISEPPVYVQGFVLNERETWEAIQAMREKKQPKQPPAPLGYKRQDDKLVVESSEADLVKKMIAKVALEGPRGIDHNDVKTVRDAFAARATENELETITGSGSRGDEIYLIFNDSMDDACEILGYIRGTEEDAETFCNEYNQKQKHHWNAVEYEAIRDLRRGANAE